MMFKRLGLMAIFFFLSFNASAWTIMPFNDAVFSNLQQQNRPILVHIHAHWCPTCTQQNMKINRIIDTSAYNDLTVLKVNFDTQKEVVKRFGATKQSVLIMYRGNAEKMRVLGETNQDAIKSVIDSGMKE